MTPTTLVITVGYLKLVALDFGTQLNNWRDNFALGEGMNPSLHPISSYG